MTNLQNYINLEASVAITGGTLVSINADGKAIVATASTETLTGIAINDAKIGEVVAVKLSYPVARLQAKAGTYTAGAVVYLGADGFVSATGDIECGNYVGATQRLTADGEIDVSFGVHITKNITINQTINQTSGEG